MRLGVSGVPVEHHVDPMGRQWAAGGCIFEVFLPASVRNPVCVHFWMAKWREKGEFGDG